MRFKKVIIVAAVAAMAASMMAGCGTRETELSTISSTTNETIKTKQLMAMLDYDPGKCVKLPKDYMSIKVDLEDDYMVNKEDIDAYISQMLSSNPSYKQTDETEVTDTSIVNIDYVGTKDGEAFDGGTAQDQFLDIANSMYIEGFAEGLVGHEVGETVSLDLTFPEEYGVEELKGQDVTFEVKINYIAEAQTIGVDDLTDEYVKENFADYGMTTVDELRSQAQQSLTQQNSSQQSADTQNAVLDYLLENSEVTIPDGMLEKEVQESKDTMKKSAEDTGMTVTDYITNYYGMTEEEYDKQLNEDTEKYVKEKMILDAIILDQKMTVSTADMYKWLSDYSTNYGMKVNDIVEQFGGKNDATLFYIENEALTKVVEGAKVSYKYEVPGKENSTEGSEENSSATEESIDTAENAEATETSDASATTEE